MQCNQRGEIAIGTITLILVGLLLVVYLPPDTMNEYRTFIPLATNLEPNAKNEALNEKESQNKLFESWTKNLELAKEKTFVLGSEVNKIFIKDKWSHLPNFKELVHSSYGDIGFFGALVTAYNNHWVLKTCPEDWWMAIR